MQFLPNLGKKRHSSSFNKNQIKIPTPFSLFSNSSCYSQQNATFVTLKATFTDDTKVQKGQNLDLIQSKMQNK